MPELSPYRGYIKWTKEDFTKHGFLATYAIGECRCDPCSEHWQEWVDDHAAHRTNLKHSDQD